MTKVVVFSDEYSIFGQVVILSLLNSVLLFKLLPMGNIGFDNLVFFDLKLH